MTCDEVRPKLADLLDELLAPDEAARLVAHLEGCAACRTAHDRTQLLLRRLYRPWDVPALSAAHGRAPERERPRRLAYALLRYAAVFVAGMLLADRLASPPAAAPLPTAAPAAVEAPSAGVPIPALPRRIR